MSNTGSDASLLTLKVTNPDTSNALADSLTVNYTVPSGVACSSVDVRAGHHAPRLVTRAGPAFGTGDRRHLRYLLGDFDYDRTASRRRRAAATTFAYDALGRPASNSDRNADHDRSR